MIESERQDQLLLEEKHSIFLRQQQDYTLACEKQRPFMLLGPKIYIDGDEWCALHGDNLQDGVAGFGETPNLAACDFDHNWNTQKINPPQLLGGGK